MAKRILLILASVFIIASCIIPFVSAEGEYIVIPDEDREVIYRIYPDESMNLLFYYEIFGYDAQSIPFIDAPNPFATTYFGDLEELSDGTYEYSLFSTLNNYRQSVLQLNITNNDTQYTLKYVVRNLRNNTEYSYFITPITSTANDVCIYADATGILYAYYFNTNNGNTVNITGYSGQELKCYFYGDIYLDGHGPSDITISDLQEAYNRGKSDGEEIGYANALDDVTPTQDQLQNAFNNGKKSGYQEGKNDGIAIGAQMGSEAAYTAGINKGQADATIIPNAITGFFDAMSNFFKPFLSIGFGNLTLYALLGIMVIVGVAVTIIKITRG